MKMMLLLAGALVFSIASPVFADCTSNGKSYVSGAEVGPYTCQEGKWVKK